MQPPLTLTMRVERKHREAIDIVSLDLVPVDGQALPAYAAGSHIDVMLPGGITRQYSLCTVAGERTRYSIAVLREKASRGGSAAIHDALQEGDTLRISPPRNHFALAHDARRHLLFAGGIGITPLLCMAERLVATGEAFELHYSARSLERLAFHDRVVALGSRAAIHLDDGRVEQRLDLHALLETHEAGRHLYVCGPNGYMDAVLDAARRSRWPEASLHREYFAPAEPDTAGMDADTAFQVRLASTGQVVAVPRGTSVTQALAAVGVHVETSCEQGVCGTCLTRVLEGVPDHRDLYLMPDEQAKNDVFMPCCSRSKTPTLLLDL